ncbi:MAG: 4'-phosphopantetheinyl transferase family protein [Acidimicrobiales bacterium]
MVPKPAAGRRVLVMVAGVGREALPGCSVVLSRAELDWAAAIASDPDRARFVTGRALLRKMLGAQLGMAPGSVPLQQQGRGPVLLALPTDVRYSVAHGGAYVAVALARRPVGVDVEPVPTSVPDDVLVRRTCTPAEARTILARPAEERRGAYIELWVRKEAVIKASSTKLALAEVDVHGSGLVTDATGHHWRAWPIPTDRSHRAVVVSTARWAFAEPLKPKVLIAQCVGTASNSGLATKSDQYSVMSLHH